MALKILRDMVAERGGGRGKSGKYGGKSSEGSDDIDQLEAEIAELKELLAHRDNEISILVNMVKQGKTIPADDGGAAIGLPSSSQRSEPRGNQSAGSKRQSEVKVTAEILADKEEII